MFVLPQYLISSFRNNTVFIYTCTVFTCGCIAGRAVVICVHDFAKAVVHALLKTDFSRKIL